MAVTTRGQLSDYALRKLGDPVIDINVDPDQIEDRIDEALEKYREFHMDATRRYFLKHQVTQDDIDNGYISVSANITAVKQIFSVSESFASGRGMFDIKYQMMLNDMAFMSTYSGDLAYYEQMQQYLSLLDTTLNGMPLIEFARRQNKIYIFGDDLGTDLTVGSWIVVEAYTIITDTGIWDDMWLKKYTTSLIKRQWGTNLMKFDGVQLPGGVTLNGRVIFEDAIQEIEKLEEELRLTFELPIDFFVG